MLHCLNGSGNLGASCSDMTVLERQREATTKWQHHHHDNHPPYYSATEFHVNLVFSSSSNNLPQSPGLVMARERDDSALSQVLAHSLKPDPGLCPELDTGFGSSSGFLPKENDKKRKALNYKVLENADRGLYMIRCGVDYGKATVTFFFFFRFCLGCCGE